jgi:malate dehydrogenase (oxaloacetate-decarboxylating)
MATHARRPIILPLSNPTSCAEARPVDLLEWTNGMAIIGTGSPFDDVLYHGRRHRIGQGNNVFIFPGVGLGTIVSKARKVTDGMFLAAAQALAGCVSDESLEMSSVYPPIHEVRRCSRQVAVAVARRAEEDGVATVPIADIEEKVDTAMWEPEYLPYRPA